MKIAFVDTETTDLTGPEILPLDKQPHCYEYYSSLCEWDSCEFKLDQISEIDVLMKPPIPIPDISSKITGIKDEDVAGCKPFSFYAADIRDQLSEADIFVAHNASFDMEIISHEFKRLGLEVPAVGVMCTVEQTEWLKGYRLRLGDLHSELFGEAFEGSHRAKVDVDAMKRCFVELAKRGIIHVPN